MFFMWGTRLNDPHKLLEGGGSQIRSVRLSSPEILDDPRIESLIADAVVMADPPLDSNATGKILVKSVSAKQRPRRPVGG